MKQKTIYCHVKDCNNLRLSTSTKCKGCKAEYDKKRYYSNLEYQRERRRKYDLKNKDKRLKYYKENKIKKLIACARTRAYNKKLEFNIDIDYIENLKLKQNNKCAYSNIEFKDNTPYSLSIDRVNNKKGYIKGNIQLVCRIINSGKGILTELEYFNIISEIYNNKIKI